jgi:hypothetical protein
VRRSDAATTYDLWHEATAVRHEWLAHGLSTAPADRAAAEDSITDIYARICRPRPRFEWVDSPAKALPLVTDLPTLADLHRWVYGRRPQGTSPLASDLAAVVSRLRSRLAEAVLLPDPIPSRRKRKNGNEPWPDLPPLESLSVGVPLLVVLQRGVRDALARSLLTGFAVPVRAALSSDPLPVCWYGQQDASWVAYFDTMRRLGLARYRGDATRHLDAWEVLATSAGWWWPGEDLCVVAERPDAVETEPVPGAWYGEVRSHLRGVRYRDGWGPGRKDG